MKKVSVIMAAFNEEVFIARSINSIINQSYSDWELIIIDDFSHDNTPEIIESFSLKDNRIKIFRNEKNLGLALSLNKAIDLSCGEYIARMDADDISLPERFEKQVRLLDLDSDLMVVGSAAYYINNNSQVKSLVRMPESHQDIVNNIFKKSPFIHPSVMMRKDFLKRADAYNPSLRRAQDYDLWLRGRFLGKYYNIQQPLIYYFQSNTGTLESFKNGAKIRIMHADTLSSFFKSCIYILYETIFLAKIIIQNAISTKK